MLAEPPNQWKSKSCEARAPRPSLLGDCETVGTSQSAKEQTPYVKSTTHLLIEMDGDGLTTGCDDFILLPGLPSALDVDSDLLCASAASAIQFSSTVTVLQEREGSTYETWTSSLSRALAFAVVGLQSEVLPMGVDPVARPSFPLRWVRETMRE